MNDEKVRVSGDISRSPVGEDLREPVLPTVNPEIKAIELEKKQAAAVHPAFYIAAWIACSSSVILFNKYILSSLHFEYPILLTTWHLLFASIMTQLMARFTTILDGRKKIPMTGRVYLRAIVPIGAFFSGSLIFGNLTYLYLSVSFIQMLKATTPVAVLLVGAMLGQGVPSMGKFLNVSIIVFGVMVATYGEINFVLTGVICQILGIIFEACRIVLVSRLLNGDEFKMEPLVSLYYFAPICAVMNFMVALFWEIPSLKMSQLSEVGMGIFLANGIAALALNCSVVFLIGRTSGLVLTLCGVLKDILLVGASILMFGTYVTPLQWFGYSIALAGLVAYKSGTDEVKTALASGRRSWDEFGVNRPILRKVLVLGGVTFTIFMLLGGFAPNLDTSAYLETAKNAVGKTAA